jgi:hypothetical protein
VPFAVGWNREACDEWRHHLRGGTTGRRGQ